MAKSLSTRERGLKSEPRRTIVSRHKVALYERAWIEIWDTKDKWARLLRRSLRESVD